MMCGMTLPAAYRFAFHGLLLSIGATALLAASASHAHYAATSQTVSPPAPHNQIHATTAASCTTPAPTTAAGYASAWAALPSSQWGAADVSISTKLLDGRDVWLYGDTVTASTTDGVGTPAHPHWTGFVHSTAITQDRGCLHVSHTGGQLLPNDDATHIYWIESATALTGDWANWVKVKARLIVLTGTGAWAFQDGGADRTASVYVRPNGDVDFIGWDSSPVPGPAPDPGPFYPANPNVAHHFAYARHTHPELTLASHKTLTTTCQNDDDPIIVTSSGAWLLPHPLAWYRPLWTEA